MGTDGHSRTQTYILSHTHSPQRNTLKYKEEDSKFRHTTYKVSIKNTQTDTHPHIHTLLESHTKRPIGDITMKIKNNFIQKYFRGSVVPVCIL